VRLTEQLLAMTRVEHAQEMYRPQAVDLMVLARQVTQEHLLQAHQCGHDLGFETTVPQGQRCEVSGVALLLHEALSNLVDNAIHHGPVGTHITVRVGERWLEVEDDGPGIAPEHQAHVFERFYRAAAAGVSGSGLGLSIVQEIAKQHAAQLQLQSPVCTAGGTIIRMAWPQLLAGPVSASGKDQ
jgi:two-component system sensor histidine kinase TctE